MIQIGRERLARPAVSPGPLRLAPNACAEVGYFKVGSTIVTATSGIIFVPALRTEITRWVCCASRCEAGKVAVVTSTGKLPTGSFASCRPALPQALSASATATAAILPLLLTLHRLTAAGTYHLSAPAHAGSARCGDG